MNQNQVLMDAIALGILQEINGSTDGFRDADGNSITPILQEAPNGITDVDELENNGLVNPLSEGSYERLANLMLFKVRSSSTPTSKRTPTQAARTSRSLVDSSLKSALPTAGMSNNP